MNKSYANQDVLEFYKRLPFNVTGSLSEQAEDIAAYDMSQQYPPLAKVLTKSMSMLEVGCGSGWFSCSVSYHHGCRVTAIDFNPLVIERARSLAALGGFNVDFLVSDLFLYEADSPYDLIVSLGVLHHTDDCLQAIRHLCTKLLRSGGHILLGLYHNRGRIPFLNHFAEMKARGAPEAEMRNEFRRLHPDVACDPVLLESWFRDQVLHPHETQHDVAEISRVFAECGVETVSTSVNRYGPFDMETVRAMEEDLERIGNERLREAKYYPGFFLVFGRKR